MHMKTSLIWFLVVVVLVVGGIWYAMSRPAAVAPAENSGAGTETGTQSAGASENPSTAPSGSSASAAPTARSFTVNGNDETADLKIITVPAGTQVSITFGADAGSTYHGGLDFRSSV